MKIAIWHNLPSGGGKRALHDQVRGLIERGHHIEVWCPPTANIHYLPLSELVKENVVPLDLAVESTKNPLKRATYAHHYAVGRLQAMERHCQRCAAEIEAGDFDLLFAGSCLWFGAPMIGRFVRGPKVLYLQEPFRSLYEASDDSPWAALPAAIYQRWNSARGAKRVMGDFAATQAARVQVREELQSARSYDEILVNSRFSRESIARAYNLDAQVCYLGIDTDRFSPLEVAREPLIIGVGAVAPRKNIEFVVRAVGQIAPQRRAPLLWIGDVADQSYAHKLNAVAGELKVDLQLKVNISDAELVGWLNRAQVMVYAPRLEPFGYTPLEANACQTPVVALAQGGVRETIQHGTNGLLVDDPPEMAAQVEDLLENRARARAIGEAGRRYVVQHWSLQAATDRLEDKLKRAVEKYRL